MRRKNELSAIVGQGPVQAENCGAQLPRDQASWKMLVRRVASVTRNPQNAEDCLHSAFLRVAEFSERSAIHNPEALLMKAAANIAVDEQRRERARAIEDRSVSDLLAVCDLQPLQDEVLLAKRRLERVAAGLAELNPRAREIFLMHRTEGLKYRDIAARVGISVSAVEKHIARTALFLAEWVEGW